MRKWLGFLVMGLALVSAAEAEPLKNKIGLSYSLLLKDGGSLTPTGLLEGLESGDSFRLRIRPGQEVYAYLVVERSPGEFQLVYPHRRSQRGRNILQKKKDFVWPEEGWLRLDGRSGTDRMYLVLAAQRIYELEARFALSDECFPESVLLDIRDRHQTDDSTYRRKIEDDSVQVRFRSHGLPAVLIEEITLRHL